ncbi:CDP-alcohol phosphatidyltransferase family protein [Flavobacteriales bacterium]|jgi:CDP-diacylglycerol---serine O-phosphatidyltransferase|nr:CDP-alcohol phosphatidyltransferase family protein [Flavobacteriales bacterium]
MNFKRLIPNTLTMGNLLGGAYVCWEAASGAEITDGRIAAIWLAAMFFDVLDGWAARKLSVEGPMGVQLDSLADLVTSGLAPAFVSYRLICESGACDSLILNALPALLVVAAAYRLARYNVSASEGVGTGFFEGLPSPAAGLFWMGMTLWWGVANTGGDYQIRVMLVVASVGMVIFPLLMVIKRPFFGLKTWGKDKTIDAVRMGLGAGFIAVAIGTWIAWGNAYAAVSLCVLLYSSLALIFAPKDITS